MSGLIVNLVYEGQGRFRPASKADRLVAEERFGQGEIIEAALRKPRSRKQHNWFFAMISEAHANQTSGPLFDDSERLRKWLLIQVGHCNVMQFHPAAMSKEVAVWLRQTYDDIDFATDGRWIYAKTARSIAWKACGSAEMTAIADKVIDVICERIVPGTTRPDWEPYLPTGKAEKRAKAA